MASTKERSGDWMRGAAGFENFYAEHFGDRWPALKAALAAASAKVRLLNPFYGDIKVPAGDVLFGGRLPVTIVAGSGEKLLPVNGIHADYELDLASVLTACALPLEKGANWLDLCAAPGGKALTKIFALAGDARTLANDVSAARVQRLKAVFHDYLPPEILAKTRVQHRDATKWRARGENFDAVLVDAPCSAEHHMLSKPKILGEWSANRSKTLAIRQHTLLCSALELVKPGGFILYSTCSISPFENDAVVERFLDKRKGRVSLRGAQVWLGERTPFGIEIHPDKCGSGPIYYSLMQRES
jgi:16S rRNA C967 or C1407 C5-methylase (RsmB/RsmF family)